MTNSRRKPVVGVMGGIGSGKSAVSNALARHGGTIIDADQLGHAALQEPEIRDQIVARWGREVLDDQGRISRRKLGPIVFADEAERKALEALVHPWIGQAIRMRIATAQEDPSVAFVVLDAAIMLEAGWSEVCDRLIFVEVPRALRLARLEASRNWSAADLDARERAQLPLTAKAARADDTIINDSTLDDLQRRVDHLVSGWSWISRPGAGDT